MKIQKSKNTLFINLPAEYIRLLGWAKGTELACYPDKDKPRVLILQEVSALKKKMNE